MTRDASPSPGHRAPLARGGRRGGGLTVRPRRFAGDVLYEAGNFLELNNDSINSKAWLETGVGNRFVQHLFTAPELQPAAPASAPASSGRAAGRAASLSQVLQSSLGGRSQLDLTVTLRTASKLEACNDGQTRDGCLGC